eukprot:scaffold119586_cov48-Prasinocladus_malaysianus.AAC.1
MQRSQPLASGSPGCRVTQGTKTGWPTNWFLPGSHRVVPTLLVLPKRTSVLMRIKTWGGPAGPSTLQPA